MEGFYLGINGAATYKNSKLPEILSAIGCEKIVLETDAPFLPPVPHRGKRNEPSFLLDTAKNIAQIFSLPIEKIDETTTENAKLIFYI